MTFEQKTISFPEHPDLQKPDYERQLTPEKFKGISPRRAFEIFEERCSSGHKPEDVAPYLVKFIESHSSAINTLLKAIAGGKSVDAQQTANAWQMRAAIQNLSPAEIALALWELNITPLEEVAPLWPSSQRFIENFHRLMGRFRTDMAKYDQS